jgi:hypothetical protein
LSTVCVCSSKTGGKQSVQKAAVAAAAAAAFHSKQTS